MSVEQRRTVSRERSRERSGLIVAQQAGMRRLDIPSELVRPAVRLTVPPAQGHPPPWAHHDNGAPVAPTRGVA